MKKKLTRSEVVQELLDSYYFQHGNRIDTRVTTRAKQMIEQFKKSENEIREIQK